LHIIGREPALIQTLEDILEKAPPDLFIDVGANNGLYSVLILVNGIDCISFEPNPTCLSYIAHICQYNNVHARIENVALSNAASNAQLAFPEGKTVLGSLQTEIQTQWQSQGYPMRQVMVQTRTLDSYFDELIGYDLLIKIDVEGHELSVLKGAQKILGQLPTRVLFESYKSDRRKDIYELFDTLGYWIYALPYTTNVPQQPLDFSTYDSMQGPDFIAVKQNAHD
jgi:FkbM family methyltransferase